MTESTKVGVKVMPREVILDTQGRAVEQILKLNGMPPAQCRVGKFIELEFQTSSRVEAHRQAEEVARKVLCNPLIETFELKDL